MINCDFPINYAAGGVNPPCAMPLVHSPILLPSAYVYDIRAVSDGWMIIVVDMMRSTEWLYAVIDLSGCGGSVKCLWKHRGSSPISCFVPC